MNKSRALQILKSIHQDIYNEWRIPHHYERSNREVVLSNGERATIVIDDEVNDFLDYIKKLIEKEEEPTNDN